MIDEKKNLKKFYVRHSRLQVTCTVRVLVFRFPKLVLYSPYTGDTNE